MSDNYYEWSDTSYKLLKDWINPKGKVIKKGTDFGFYFIGVHEERWYIQRDKNNNMTIGEPISEKFIGNPDWFVPIRNEYYYIEFLRPLDLCWWQIGAVEKIHARQRYLKASVTTAMYDGMVQSEEIKFSINYLVSLGYIRLLKGEKGANK